MCKQTSANNALLLSASLPDTDLKMEDEEVQGD